MPATKPERLAFRRQEYALLRQARRAGDIGAAWRHLERAHIVAQPLLGPHIGSHWRMAVLALATRDPREVGGQALRLILAILGGVVGRLPVGNTGRARISPFAPLPLPPDLVRFQ